MTARFLSAQDIADERAASANGIVYLLSALGSLKIGWASRDVARRVRSLQPGCPAPLVLVASIPGSRVRERELHVRFAEHRIFGEWFVDHPCIRDAFSLEGQAP